MEKVLPDSIEDLSLTTFKMITHHIHVLKEERMKRSLVKKVLTLAVTACMALTSVAAFAEETAPEKDKYNLTVNEASANGSLSGNEYTAYKVMEATKHSSGGDKVVYTYEPAAAFADFFKADSGYGYTLNDDGEIVKGEAPVATDNEWANVNATEAAKLASALEKYVAEKGIAGTKIAAGASLNTEIGYYLVSETNHVVENTIASKPVLVDLTTDKTITVKDDKVNLEKVIVEDNTEKKTNSVNIGDVIQYKATTNIPSYKAVNGLDQSKLRFTLTDTFSTGITYNQNVVVKIGDKGKEAVVDLGKSVVNNTTGFVIALTSEQILQYQGQSVVLEYSGTLNENAVVNSTQGNPNDIKLEYSDNPNEDNGYGTLEDKTITYTFGFELRKVDANNITEDLAGAGFDIKDGETTIASITYDNEGKPVVTKGENVGVIVEVDHEKNDLIKVKGVEANTEKTYTIHETKAPEGYSLIGSDITVTIKAETDGKDSKGQDKLTGKATYTVAGGNSPAVYQGDDKDKAKEAVTATELVVDEATGHFDIKVLVKDFKGISLPETGSRSALFCMIGGAFIVLLGALYYEFAVRRKKA